MAYGALAALDDRPRPGKEPTITAEAKTWMVDAGLPEGQGARLSARVVDDATSRPPCPRAWTGGGAPCLRKLAQGTLCNILDAQEVKPHKVRYYLERRDPEFKQKMAEVLCVYREVKRSEGGGGRRETKAERCGDGHLL